MKRTLTEMKTRLDQRLRENQRLQEERDRLEDILAKMKGELNQIQSQVSSLNQFLLTHPAGVVHLLLSCVPSHSLPSLSRDELLASEI